MVLPTVESLQPQVPPVPIRVNNKPTKMIGRRFTPVDQYTHPDRKNYPASSRVPLPGDVNFVPTKPGYKSGYVVNKPSRRFHR